MSGARFPRRRGGAVPVATKTPFIAFSRPWQVKPGVDSLAVVVKMTFDIVPDGPVRPRAECDLANGDVHLGDDPRGTVLYPSDFAILKPRCDVTLSGSAHAPAGGASMMEVRFAFGRGSTRFDRRIAVLGDRRWQKAVVKTSPGAPERFESMPLVYERAFGGATFDPNPVGRGRAGELLPNLEDPKRLVASPSDTPEPVCFAGIPEAWPARRSKLGTYDGAWQKKRWPYFPDDFDWAAFQAAPVAQQLDTIAGDEPFEIEGMHPKHPRITGKLAGLAPRCFAQRTDEAGAAFQEIALRLDTVAFDLAESKVNLVWRGLLGVADDEASDICELFVMEQPAGAPRADISAARDRYFAERSIRALPVGDDPDAPPANDAPRPKDDMEAHGQRVRERLASAGVPAEGPASGGAPISRVAPPAAPRLAAVDDPRVRELATLTAAGVSLAGLDLAAADLVGRDLSGQSLEGANLMGAALRGARLAGSDLRGAQLTGADLGEADLTGANLEGADLTGATLENARLDGAKIGLAVFAGARGARASFRGAEGSKASFVEGKWKAASFEKASLPSADFTGASLDEAVFDGAILSEVRLYEARGSRVSLRNADLTDARADDVCLPQATLLEVRAAGSVWDGAVLDRASFRGASLAGASFARASCPEAIFASADLTEARLQRAQLQRANLAKANLMQASLESADLGNADLRGANLHAAETWKANLRGAKLDLAIVSQSKLAKEAP